MNDFYQIKNPMWHNPNQMFPGMNMPFNNINLNGIVLANPINNWNQMFPGMNIPFNNINLNGIVLANPINNWNQIFPKINIPFNTGDINIEPSGDNVFHISEAIISNALKLDDKKLMSNEKEYTEKEVKNKVISFASAANVNIASMPLSVLPNLIKNGTTALKRATTKLWAKFCTNAFNKIRNNKDIQKCVNELSNALIRYSQNDTFENCENIITIQEKLKNAIWNAGCMNNYLSVNEILNTVFVRVAVDKFFKKFGNLGNPNTLHNLKSTFNSLYNRNMRISFVKKGSPINFNKHLNNLIYGFGFYPSSVDIEMKNLSRKNNGTTELFSPEVLSALMSLSKEYALTIKNGKKFEILNTGSYSDNNCEFRAIAVGVGFGPNGYNIIQQKVVEGAEKLLNNWDNLDLMCQMKIFKTLKFLVDANKAKLCKLSDMKNLLQEYIAYRGQGFVKGGSVLEFIFAAIGLGRPICVVDVRDGTEHSFFPDGKMENKIHNNYFGYGSPIYVGSIAGHAEALLPLDYKGLQKMAAKLLELNKKASDMKKALAKHISAVIHSNAMNGIMLFPGVNVFDKASVDAFAYNWANIWVEK